MADDLQRGLFFPGEAAARAAAPAAAQPAQPRAVDPTAAAAAEVLRRPKRRLFDRRVALRWAGWGSLIALIAGWGNGFLGFFRPGRTGSFGGVVSAGTVQELNVGDVKQVTEGKFWLTRVPEGFLALWWKCPHLGCTVPWKETDPVMEGDTAFADSGRFNCPCHGSIYNRYGQIIQGPAPRPMDAFPVTIEGDRIRVQTGPQAAITRERSGPDSQAIARA
jgi:cytochrome b6-f complex iron-sulfur subunit